MVKKLNIALFGPPGAGKGTQSLSLIARYSLVHIAPGDLFRENMGQKTALGKEVRKYICAGKLVPDELVITTVEAKMKAHPQVKGFLFDGYPRTCDQAKALDAQLAQYANSTLDLVFFLQVDKKEGCKRIKKRSIELNRPDDQHEEQIATRFHHYQESSLPVSAYYKKQGKLIYIGGVGDVSQVRQRIQDRIGSYLATA